MNRACEICRGACCEYIELPLVKMGESIPDVARWIKFHGDSLPDGVILDCPCNKLKGGKCSIYEDRPQICRDSMVGSSKCLEAIERRRHHTKKEILRAMNEPSI